MCGEIISHIAPHYAYLLMSASNMVKIDFYMNCIISEFNPYKMELYDLIIKNTVVKTKEDTIQNIRMSIEKWKLTRPNKKLYVNLATGKIGSEQWLYLELNDILPEHTILVGEIDKIDENSEILYIDDGCFSGCNACGILETMLYKKGFNNILYTFIFYVITDGGMKQIDELMKSSYKHINYKLIYSLKLDRMDKILSNNNVIPNDDVEIFHKKYSPDTEYWSYPFYFDYKIPNQFGSYPEIYKNIHVPCRTFMEEVGRKWLSF